MKAVALPKKKLRHITVGDVRYAWSATGNDGWISLTVCPCEFDGQILCTSFGYQYFPDSRREERHFQTGEVICTSYPLNQHKIITPAVVRQVIKYAIKHGWQPEDKGLFKLPTLDGVIELANAPAREAVRILKK